MAEDVGSLVVRVAMENSSFQQGVQNLNRSMKVIQSEFKNATSGLKDHGKGLDGLKAKQEMLGKSVDVQSKLVQKYKDKLKESKDTLNKNAEAQVKLKEKVDNAKRAYEESKNTLGENNEKTKELKSSYEELSGEYTRNEERLRSNTRTVDNYNTRVNNAQSRLNIMQRELRETTTEVDRQSSRWHTLSQRLETVGKGFKKVGEKMGAIGKEMTLKVTAPIAALGTGAVRSAIDFESAFAGVKKTVNGTEEQFAQMEKGITDMSKKLPTSATDIAHVAEAAGQLGIETDNILGFSKTIIDLGNATNLVGEEGATQLAKFANITSMSQKDFDRLGSTIVSLGNNMATTEADIVAMGMRLAGAGHQVGLTEAQIMGLSAGLSSVGIEAEAGGSAVSKVLVEMQLAVEKGGNKLNSFAKVAGMSGKDFQKAFKKDAAGALIEFIKGLSESEKKGTSAIKVLDDMGITEVRMRDALLRAAGAGDLFNKAINIGTDAWKENTALTNEANQRYATTESQLKILKNQILAAARSIGQNLLPVVRDVAQKIANLTKRFSELSPETQKTIIKIAAIAAAIGPLLLVGSKIALMVGGIITAVSKFSATMAAGGTVFKATLAAIGGPAVAITAAIMAIAAAGIALYLNWDKIKGKAGELKEGVCNKWSSLKQSTSETWNNIKTSTANSWNGIKTSVVGSWNNIKDGTVSICGNIKNSIVNIWNSIKESIKSVVLNIYHAINEKFQDQFELIRDVMQRIKNIIKDVWEVIKTIVLGLVLIIIDIVTGNFERLKTDTSQIMEKLGTLISNIWENIKYAILNCCTAILGIVSKIWGDIKEAISNRLKIILNAVVQGWESMKQSSINKCNNIKQGVINIWNSILNWFTTLPSRLYNLAVSMFTSMKNGVSSTTSAVTKSAKDIGASIINAFKELPGKMIEIGKNVIEGLIHGITSGVGKVVDAAKNLGNSVANTIRKTLDIHSPSRVMIEIGKYTVEGLAKGIRDNTSLVTKEMIKLANAITGSDIKDKLSLLFSNPLLSINSNMDRLGIDTGDLNKNLENQKLILEDAKDKVTILTTKWHTMGKQFTYSSKECLEAKKELEDAITAVEKLGREVEETQEKIRKAQETDNKNLASGLNDIFSKVKDSLKEHYNDELKMNEENINKQIEANNKWKDNAIKNIDTVYNFKIKALDNELKAHDIAKQNEEDNEKETELKKILSMNYSKKKKEEAQKELDKLLKDREERKYKESIESQKDALKTQYEADKDAVENIAKNNDEYYKNQLDGIKSFYGEKLKEANINAEAEKMIVNNNQKDIVKLLKSYGKDYEVAGASLGERFVKAFENKLYKMADLMNGVTNKLTSSVAVTMPNISGLAGVGGYSSLSNINNSKTDINNNYGSLLKAENININGYKDTQAFAQELEFYRQQAARSRGGNR